MNDDNMEDLDLEGKTSLLNNGFSHRFEERHDRRRSRYWLNFSLLLNLCFVVVFVTWVGKDMYTKLSDPFNNRLLRLTSMPSPIFDKIHIDTPTTRREGAIMPHSPPSIWRQDPSPEVDRAWHRVSNSSPIAISAQDVRNIGEDPEKVAKWPAEYGFGDDAYWGRLDVFHEIHCLNMLRKAVHWEYYDDYDRFSEASLIQRSHIGHCFHTLMQELMCQANTNAYIHYWVDSDDSPIPDWTNRRQCRDFDSILAYQEANGVSMTRITNVIKKPADAYQKALSLEYKFLRGDILNDPALNRTAAQVEDMEEYGRLRGSAWRDSSDHPSPDFM